MFKKKLKKIPADLVSYIQIETEAIKDANDKMMISSYCLGKLELVNWYLELLAVGSEKYIVPQSKAHLETIRDQLLVFSPQIWGRDKQGASPFLWMVVWHTWPAIKRLWRQK